MTQTIKHKSRRFQPFLHTECLIFPLPGTCTKRHVNIMIMCQHLLEMMGALASSINCQEEREKVGGAEESIVHTWLHPNCMS